MSADREQSAVLAKETKPASAEEQRRRLLEAAARIRAVIDDLALREPHLRAVEVAAPAQAAPEPAAAARIRPMRVAGAALIGFGLAIALFLAFEFFYTGQLESRSQHALMATFRQRLAAGPFDAPDQPVQSGPVAVLRIPALGGDQVVVQGSSPEDLKQGPGHLPGTPLPGEFGNSVVVGHRLTYGGPFAHLDRLATGDTITVLTGQGQFAYKVTHVATVQPGQSDVIGPTADSRLTLITSTSPLSSDRRAVTATLIGNPVGVATRPPATAGSDELGTVGDVAGLYLAIIWLIALAAVAVAAVFAYRNWPRAAAHLVTTPAMLMLLYLAFISLDRFLPGTL